MLQMLLQLPYVLRQSASLPPNLSGFDVQVKRQPITPIHVLLSVQLYGSLPAHCYCKWDFSILKVECLFLFKPPGVKSVATGDKSEALQHCSSPCEI